MSKMLIVAASIDNVKDTVHLLQVGGQTQVYKRCHEEHKCNPCVLPMVVGADLASLPLPDVSDKDIVARSV
jgi:hypothetical protein